MYVRWVEERDAERIKMVLSTIQGSLNNLIYHLQDDYPGLTRQEKAFIHSLQQQSRVGGNGYLCSDMGAKLRQG